MQAALARVVMGLQFGGIAAVLAGDKICPALGMEVPQLLAQMQEKRMGVVMGLWLLGNAAQNQLTSTGAFEVFYDGKKVRVLAPQPPRLLLMGLGSHLAAAACCTDSADSHGRLEGPLHQQENVHSRKHAQHLRLPPGSLAPAQSPACTVSAAQSEAPSLLPQMHSKLGTGRVPSMEELISSIELAMGS